MEIITKNNIKKYSTYKNSGVEWLGEIPEHWEVKKLKYVLTEINERSETGKEELLSLSKTKGVIPKSTLGDRSGQANSLIGYKKVYNKSLVINKMQAVNGLLSVSKINGITSPDYSIYKSLKDNDIKYFGYLLNLPIYLDEFKKVVTGVMEGFIRLYTDDLYNIKAHIPPLKEQKEIAKFLDDKTKKIDEAIAIKTQQINLLKERKQILIHKAVTRGLDTNVKLKNSGVEWIGEIPVGWEVSRLGLMLTPYSIKNKPNETLLSITRELGIIKRDLEDLESNHNFIPEDLTGYKLIQKGDFGMNKMKAWQGSYGVSKFTGIVSPAYYTFKIVDSINPDFFHLAIRSKNYVPFFGQASDGVRIGQWDLSKDRMKMIPFIIPTLKEQTEILDYIEKSSEKIATAIGLKAEEIEKLKEYKSSLINSVVTGKVRVC